MSEPKFDGITITSDGMTVTARHYTNGEVMYAAEAKTVPWEEFNFLSIAIDALHKLKDKEQGSSTAEFAKEAWNYVEQEVHKECTEHTFDYSASNKRDEILPLLSALNESVNYRHHRKEPKSLYDYYANKPDLFWFDFKLGIICLQVHRDEWFDFALRCRDNNVWWIDDTVVTNDFRSFNDDDYVCVCCKDKGLVWGFGNTDFGLEIFLNWGELKLYD